MPRSPFREVWHLMIAPDFSRVMTGEVPPPWVDQHTLDFPRLRELLDEHLVFGSASLRIPNDTIDQVTIHTRIEQSALGMEAMRCTDLADILRAEGRQQSAEIIDVRRAWKDKQPLNDRNVVPPPVVLPMLLEADDFEDMMLSRSSATMVLGMYKEHPIERMARRATESQGVPKDSDREEPQEGRLPPGLLAGFQELFGIPYKVESVIDVVSHDTMPAWARV